MLGDGLPIVGMTLSILCSPSPGTRLETRREAEQHQVSRRVSSAAHHAILASELRRSKRKRYCFVEDHAMNRMQNHSQQASPMPVIYRLHRWFFAASIILGTAA